MGVSEPRALNNVYTYNTQKKHKQNKPSTYRRPGSLLRLFADPGAAS